MMIWALKQQLNKSLTLVLPFNVALEPRNYPNIFSNFSPCTNLILPACAIQLVPLQYLGLANTSCFVSLFRSAFTVAGVPPALFSIFSVAHTALLPKRSRKGETQGRGHHNDIRGRGP